MIGGCFPMNRRKWTLEEQSKLLKMSGELLSRGYSLSDALESVIYHFPKNRSEEIKNILQGLIEGYPLYIILQKLKFDQHLTGYIFFAEQHGNLETAFSEGGKMLQKRAEDIAKLVKLITYPLFLILMTIVLFFFVQNNLLPRFSTLFTTMDIEANFFSYVISIVDKCFPILLISILILVITISLYYFLWFKHISSIKQKIVITRIPVAARLLRLFYTHYFCVQLGYLLAGGLSINEALTMFEKNKEQSFYKQVAGEIKTLLKTGETLVEILNKYPFFEKDLPRIVKHGQENGRLSQELIFLSSRCLHLLEEQTDQLMKKVQPIIFLFIGFMIISMYLAVLLPMFQLLEGI